MTNKDEKGTKVGVSFSAVGLNWVGGTSGPPMFEFARGIPLPISWMVLGPNGTACTSGRTDLYQARYDYNKKGYFDSETYIRYIQHCVIAVQRNIASACWSILIIDGINTHLSHDTIQCVGAIQRAHKRFEW